MALYVTVLGLVGGDLLVSNKPLDNRSSRREHTHDVDVLRVIRTAAVRDVFTLIDSDRDRYHGAAAIAHCTVRG